MIRRSTPDRFRLLPLVLAATFVVAVCPTLAVWELERLGVHSTILLLIVGLGLSLAVSWGGDRAWRSHSGGRDVVFSELMLWGWLRRWHVERQLAGVTDLLGFDHEGGMQKTKRMPTDRRAELLGQLASTLEAGDRYTHGHSRRVARHVARVAARMGRTPAEQATIRTAAILHDLGKVRTPAEILNKPGRLTDEEFDVIKRHPGEGADMVSILGDERLTAMVRHHHERLDGTGYPAGLSGDLIPLGARMIAVADTFDALTSLRPYRKAKSHREAIAILREEAGTQLDPDVVQAFCDCYSGRRPLALWAIATNAPPRLAGLFSGGAPAIGTASVAPLLTAAAATAAMGAAAPLVSGHHTSVASAATPISAPQHTPGDPSRTLAASNRSRLARYSARHSLPSSRGRGSRKLVTLLGPRGPAGPPGLNGVNVHDGAPGPVGSAGGLGLRGPAGASGPAGQAGSRGLRGVAGDVGAAGAQGLRGAIGLPGAIGPRGLVGAPGAIGPRGPAGAPGLAGIPGLQGVTGDTGPTGPAGPAGPLGIPGLDGLPGGLGPAGPSGAVGPAGPPGPTGADGPPGPTGADGNAGVAGPTGPTGSVGPPGPAGPAGPTGGGVTAWAAVAADGKLQRASSANVTVSKVGTGSYVVDAGQDISNCVYSVQIAPGTIGTSTAGPAEDNPNAVAITIFVRPSFSPWDGPFAVLIAC